MTADKTADSNHPAAIVITGAASGIGRAVALRMGREGAAVGVWDVNAEGAEAVAAEIRAGGGRAVGVACDVTNRASIDRARDRTLSELGKVWGLVSNAGLDRLSLFKDADPAEWKEILEVNLVGALNVTHSLLPQMIAGGGGRIVCVSSDAARVGSTGEAVYAASKSGLLGFVKTLAREVARNGIAVNVVCPGPTDTALLASVRNRENGERIMEAMKRAIPMGRIAQPEDIAGAIAFFLSGDAGYITGQVLSVSGGLTMVG